MKPTLILKENWLSREPREHAEVVTALTTLLLILGSSLFATGAVGARSWMPASVDSVFGSGEYWRLWTTLFSHGGLDHLLSNLTLFIPLAYFLSGYFGAILFPIAGFLAGGFINYLTMSSMPSGSSLIGVSGVVYWMGAVWLTLYLLIERKESVRRRIGKVLVVGAGLFLPQGFEPNISYLSHFYGFMTGVVFAGAYFYFMKNKIRAAEVYEAEEEDKDAICEMPGFDVESCHGFQDAHGVVRCCS